MKNTSTLIALLTGSAFVTVPCAQPESDIAIPAEKTEITQGAPDLGQKGIGEWEKHKPEFPQIEIPRPIVHDPMPFPKGPKI